MRLSSRATPFLLAVVAHSNMGMSHSQHARKVNIPLGTPRGGQPSHVGRGQVCLTNSRGPHRAWQEDNPALNSTSRLTQGKAVTENIVRVEEKTVEQPGINLSYMGGCSNRCSVWFGTEPHPSPHDPKVRIHLLL